MAGLLSATLHLGLLLLATLSGGRQDGVHDDDTPVTRVVLFEADVANRSDGTEPDAWQPSPPAMAYTDEPQLEFSEPMAPSSQLEHLTVPEFVQDQLPVEAVIPSDTALLSVIDPLSTSVAPPVQASALLQRIEKLAEEVAEELAGSPNAYATWREDGRQYRADFVIEPARDGIELDRVIAEISADDRGRQLKTRVYLKRLPFSHFTQVIDRWDPMVQLHDDEIVGRTHINSRFNALFDGQASPQVLGKLSTASGRINLESRGRRNESDAFRQGVETNAGRIVLRVQDRAFDRARRDPNSRVHELTDDTRIRFLADGSYSWRESRSDARQVGAAPGRRAVYFIAAPGATVYVQGVVAGRFLVYSPQKIVVEGSLTYARDPRVDSDSDDFLGLVCDRDIEVAPPRVTGPGDLNIYAALFARRRFVVTDIGHTRLGTLHIYGSLAAGSLTASEPRYATKVVYDGRLEQLRPPGFPSTDRFAADDWDGRWTEVPERSAAGMTQGTL